MFYFFLNTMFLFKYFFNFCIKYLKCFKLYHLVAFLIGTIFSSFVLEHVEIINFKNFIGFICYENNTNSSNDNTIKFMNENIKSTFAIYGRSTKEGHLIHVLNVLKRLGLRRVSLDENWDLLWAHDFPFNNLSIKIKNLAPHQKVNHFPGCGFLTNKVDLSVTNLPFQPESFRLPGDKDKFIEYSKQFPEKLFVEKHNEHRHIYVKEIKNINLDSNDTFVQEFIDKPYLVDGYKFDIGVYVILTSVNPLRIYIYTGDVLFRYCTEKYYPFNSSNINKYVVGDDYLPSWNVPSLKHFHNNFKFGMKDAFDTYVNLQNQDSNIIWNQVEDIIRRIILKKERNIINILRRYKSNKNFFELMRFDFVLDKYLKVWLMEANMSPNLSSAHFKQNALLYEQILYSVLRLVNVGLPIYRESFKKRDTSEELMLSSEKNVAVFPQECFEGACHFDCHNDLCAFCINCLSKQRLENFHDAYREHINKAEMKRVFPKPIDNVETYNIENEVADLSMENKFMTVWFYGKCLMDSNWC